MSFENVISNRIKKQLTLKQHEKFPDAIALDIKVLEFYKIVF